MGVLSEDNQMGAIGDTRPSGKVAESVACNQVWSLISHTSATLLPATFPLYKQQFLYPTVTLETCTSPVVPAKLVGWKEYHLRHILYVLCIFQHTTLGQVPDFPLLNLWSH